VVCPAAGALRVPLDGVAANAGYTARAKAISIAGPRAFMLFILIPPGNWI